MNKAELRSLCISKRKGIKNKNNLDSEIERLLLLSEEYSNAQTVLCYASLEDEINTDGIIIKALSDKKQVALPVCINKNGDMEFYLISSMEQLIKGAFSVLEPDVNICKRLCNYDNAIIVVPGLCFDRRGYRLGYGKGYYDRFLKNHSLISIGLCYNIFIIDNQVVCDYDIPVNAIITENGIIYCDNGGKNG